MGSDLRDHVLRQLGFVVASWREDRRSDIELLTRFVQTRDEQAFSAIVGRHAQLVWGVCRRILANQADAEDALQATFLRLARDASRIVNRQALASWLFTAARGCAIDLRRMVARQRRIEERLAAIAERANDNSPPTDLRVLLDDELAQLPERERAVLVMCCLEGRTYADVALDLRCSVAAVHRRLVRAQTRLRRRLARHGPAAVVAFAGGAAFLASGAVSAAILARTVEAGLRVAHSGLLPSTQAGTVAGLAAAQKSATGTVVALGVAAVLMGGFLVDGLWKTAKNESAASEPPNAVAPEIRARQNPVADSRAVVSGVVREPSGAPVSGAVVAAMARRPFGPGERGLRDEVLAVTTADPDGRFDLRLPNDFATWFADRVVTVQATAPGYAPITSPVRVQAPPKVARVELNLPAATTLRGRLLDSTGQPAAGVKVAVVRVGEVVAEPVIGAGLSLPPGWPASVTTQEDGTFSLPALGGTPNVWVRVADTRFALDTFRVDQPGGRTDFRLDEARTLAVEVRAADTGNLLPGARLTVITDRRRSHPHFCATEHGILGPRSVPADIDAVTDARGTFRVGVARGDRVELLVHPPSDSDAGPYLGIRTQIEVGDDPASRSPVVRLPRGRWVSGVVTDSATGKPIAGAAVHWGREDATKPEWRDDVLVGRDAITHTDSDGVFRLAVLPGPCSLRVYGPTLDYTFVSARVPGTASTTLFAHDVTHLDAPERGEIPSVRVALNPATPRSGRVECDSGTTDTTLLLCSGRVSPVRPYASLSLPVRDGTFTVPGCRSDHATRAYLLDPVTRVGAVIDVTPETPAPTVKLAPCGQLRVRVLGADGRPRPGQDVSVSLLIDRDRPTGTTTTALPADAQPVEWFDAVNYLTRPKTNAEGVAELPALIPGARYSVAVGSGAGKSTLHPVLVESGKTVWLPDVILADTPTEPGGAR
jgi:RNA polymerase sigma factor (sigma-70 family)